MPLPGQHEPLAGQLQRLDHPVGVPRADRQPRTADVSKSLAAEQGQRYQAQVRSTISAAS